LLHALIERWTEALPKKLLKGKGPAGDPPPAGPYPFVLQLKAEG